MRVWLRFAALVFVVCALTGAAGSARAQTLATLNSGGTTTFTYGNQQFTITGCVFDGATCSSSYNAKIIGVTTLGGKTEIEVTRSTGSYIYSGTGTYSLAFNLNVATVTGTPSINQISQILSATDTSSAGNSDVYSAITGTSPTTFGQIKSIIGTATSATFTPTTSANFSISMGTMATAGQTLKLADVVFVINPALAAPEPASILLFGTGVAGLAAIRRRFGQRMKAQRPA